MIDKESFPKIDYEFNDLLDLMQLLRHPEEGCPWDRVQTHKSIRKNLIEETYEVLEGIDKNDDAILVEELGDLLLQVVFHCRIAEEENRFSIDDVINGVCQKLVRRHPYIFPSDLGVNTWDDVKKIEKGDVTVADNLRRVCDMPALLRAQKIISKSAKAGFTWDSDQQALNKIDEEKKEYIEAIEKGDNFNTFEEAGDLLFSCVAAISRSGVDCEEALTASTNKFIDRFGRVEQAVKSDNKDIKSLNEDELISYWCKAK